jgi:SAM-dependent methyltransferase
MTVRRGVPSGIDMTEADEAKAFWLRHSREMKGVAAVHSTRGFARYHAWTRQMLMDWTVKRLRATGNVFVRIADLGCGIGDWTERLADLAVDTYACDVSPEFVAQTRARVPHAVVACSDLRDYRMPVDLDLVYVGAVLMYLPDGDVRDVLRRIRAVMRPGGLVVLRDYGAINLGRPRGTQISVHRRPRELQGLATEAYLRCIERRVSPSIYGEVMARGTVWQWPLRALWRLATAHWLRASYTLICRAD